METGPPSDPIAPPNIPPAAAPKPCHVLLPTCWYSVFLSVAPCIIPSISPFANKPSSNVLIIGSFNNFIAFLPNHPVSTLAGFIFPTRSPAFPATFPTALPTPLFAILLPMFPKKLPAFAKSPPPPPAPAAPAPAAPAPAAVTCSAGDIVQATTITIRLSQIPAEITSTNTAIRQAGYRYTDALTRGDVALAASINSEKQAAEARLGSLQSEQNRRSGELGTLRARCPGV